VTAWLAALRDRPIAERERHHALLAVAALLIATTTLLALTSPRQDPPRRTHGASILPRAAVSRPVSPGAGTVRATPRESTIAPAAELRTARAFLENYLAYLYGHAHASAVRDATQALVLSLEAHPPRVSLDMRARRPRVLALHPAPAPPGQAAVDAVDAVVNDGGLEDYPVGLLLARRGGRLLVTGLESEG
jgi:hypothetical protein